MDGETPHIRCENLTSKLNLYIYCTNKKHVFGDSSLLKQQPAHVAAFGTSECETVAACNLQCDVFL
jgi:hypothetical protein